MGGDYDWDFALAGEDLVGILRRDRSGRKKKVEVHIYSAASRYKEPLAALATAFDMGGDYDWDFALAGEDLVGILRRDRSGRKKKVEVHIYSAASRYTEPRSALATAFDMGPMDPKNP